MYMKATLHVVGAERAFSTQNLMITDLRNSMLSNKLSMQVLIQTLSRLLSAELVNELIKEASSMFMSEVKRRKGAGHL